MMGSVRHRARGGLQGRLFAWIMAAGAVSVLAGITAAFLLDEDPRPPLVRTALAVLGALVLLSLLAYAIALRFAAPIRRLRDTAALLVRSDRPTSIMRETGDEIEELADALARTKEKLDRAAFALGDEDRLHAVAETAIDAIISADSRGNITFWNKGAEKIFGYAPGEVIGKPLTLLMPVRFRDAHGAGLRRLLEGGEPRVIGKVVELAGIKKDGSEFPLELSLAAWDTREGPHFAGIIRDITERKRAEWRLAVQYAGTRVLAESATLAEATPKILQGICESLGWDLGAIWIMDQEANVLRCVNLWHSPNVNVAEFEEVTRNITFAPGVGLPGRVWSSGQPAWIPDVVKDPNFPRAPIALKVGLHGAFAFPILIRSGESAGVIEFFSHEIQQPDEDLLRMLSAIGSQIGQVIERKRAEERLHYLKEYIETILDSMPNPVLIVGQEERVEYINRASQEAFDLPDRAVSRFTLFDLIRTDHATREQMGRGLEQHVGLHQVTLATFLQGRPQQPEQARDPLSPPPDSGESPLRNEVQIGNSRYQYAWFHVKARPGEGKKAGLVLRDITEESLLHDQLIQAEKLAGLWVLTSGVAHELNNPLYAILGLSEAMLDESEMAPMKEHAKGIVGEAKRMARIVQDFTGQTRAEAAAPRMAVDINEQLDQALRSARMNVAGEHLVVRTDYEEVPRIEANPLEIWQALMTVITNAIQAMKGHGELHLKTEVAGGAITVQIRDSGPGIPNAYVSKIFDPFFTTKGQGEGTGLGLTIARRIVTKYGGRIRVETREGHGATFILTFPCSGPR